ncbi:vacuolar protein sorting 41 [Wolffia australiana]
MRRSSRSPENGVDGDDEREEEEEDEDEEQSAVDESDEEPRLKYQRMEGNVPSLLSADAASSIAVSERMIALGTRGGVVHILDFQGNQIKEFRSHSATVNDLCFDSDGEFIGSCSDDGLIVINSLFTDESFKFVYHRPMKALALDPSCSRKSFRRFVTGGLAGHLILCAKTWLGYRDKILHYGEGPIHAVKWRTTLIAWANDTGVKIYDMGNDQRIAFIEKPRGNPLVDMSLPLLIWQDDTVLVIGWGSSIKVVAIRTKTSQRVDAMEKPANVSTTAYADIVASVQTGYLISGIAPYGDALVVLAYISEKLTGGIASTNDTLRQGTAYRPEVHMLTWKNEELSSDSLPVHGFEHYLAKDYVLAHSPFNGSSYAGGQWAAGDEPMYYIVCPKDVVIARPRDAEDHISWLLQHGFHEKALAAVEAGQEHNSLLDEVGSRYLDHLVVERKYVEAASLCPKLLRGSTSAWERWVFHFAQLRQLPCLVPYMPTANPQLSDTAYEVALVALANDASFHKELLTTIKTWPPEIYSVLHVISAVETQIKSASATELLKEALAELYVINKQYEKAFALYADMMNPGVFDFIENHSLHDFAQDKVVQLMMLDLRKAVAMLIQHRDITSVSEVISQLRSCPEKCDKNYFLHEYLHSLFEVDSNAGKDFHDLQVGLYAEYEPRLLLPFLQSSQHYKLDKAYEICVRKDLLREQVFILGRMGNARKALSVIINKLEDIEQAIEFVSTQHDDELWEVLISQCRHKPEMIGALLEHTVGNLDPLYIVRTVPEGLRIPRLRDRLIKIITDYRTETSLRQGCNDILKADVVNLLIKYYKEARRAVYMGSMEGEKNSVRCCLCLDRLSRQDSGVVVFFCCHAYHLPCLTSGAAATTRCVLCTTAAG